jgi:hypothetical protein
MVVILVNAIYSRFGVIAIIEAVRVQEFELEVVIILLMLWLFVKAKSEIWI